jgi:hypothetical protein
MSDPCDAFTLYKVKNEILVKETLVSLQEFMSSTKTNILLCSMNTFICCLLSLHKGIVVLTLGCLTLQSTGITICEPLYVTNTSHRKQETFLYEYPFYLSPFAYKERTTQRCSSIIHSSNTVAILATETSL